MVLKITGDINRYYVQTLCMVFFPGATFGEDEESAEGVPEIHVLVEDHSDRELLAKVDIYLNDKVSSATEIVSLDEPVYIATHAAIAVGRAMFAAGREMLDHIPPWGILTGIRPAKIAAGLLRETRGILKTKKILRDEYFLNPQKAALAVSVASTEMKMLKKIPKDTCALYVSIPFCPSRCAYCSFVSYTTPRLLSMIDDYLNALCDEIDEIFEVIKETGLTLSTIYIGGGTPTTLSPKQLKKLLSKIASKVDTSTLLEYTLEAGRPDTITAKKLEVAKEYGITRISVNPQTLNDDILKDIGRHHTVADFYNAFKIAKESGIRDINVDLIAGLTGDDFKNFSETVDRIIELQPTNITVHTFCVKKASDALKQNSNVYSLSGGDASKSVSYSQLKTKFAGYKPYYMYRQKNTVGNLENVGFSIEGHESYYNVIMMEETQSVFAVGAGAVSKIVDNRGEAGTGRIERIFNLKYPYEYLRNADALKQGEIPPEKSKKSKILKAYHDIFG